MFKKSSWMRETWLPSWSQEDPLEKEMATHSNILAWIIPWTAAPGGLQSMRSQRVRHNWASNTQTINNASVGSGPQITLSGADLHDLNQPSCCLRTSSTGCPFPTQPIHCWTVLMTREKKSASLYWLAIVLPLTHIQQDLPLFPISSHSFSSKWG